MYCREDQPHVCSIVYRKLKPEEDTGDQVLEVCRTTKIEQLLETLMSIAYRKLKNQEGFWLNFHISTYD